MWELTNNQPSFTTPVDEASGTRYRKIALNGLPMGDEKPQTSAESDQEKEESYVDSLTLQLHHSTTDAYIPISGSDFALSVRRDVRSQVWNSRTGLRGHEVEDSPFGLGWSTNVTPLIKFITDTNPQKTSPDQAQVTDEGGAVHSFLIYYDGTGAQKFFPMPSAKNEAQTPNLETLSLNNGYYIFTRKYGATLTFSPSQSVQPETIADDRVLGSPYGTTISYATITQAVDRVGNIINYQYAIPFTLIPSTITVANQPDLVLTITQQPFSTIYTTTAVSEQELITAITDARGHTTNYTYAPSPSDPTAPVLTKVTAPDGSTTQYSYSTITAADTTPIAPGSGDPGSLWYYLDVSSITDPLGNEYQIAHNLNYSRYTYLNNSFFAGYYPQSGVPTTVSKVTLPGGLGSATFQNDSAVYVSINGSGKVSPSGQRDSVVTDATGFTRTWVYAAASVFPLPNFPSAIPSSNVEATLILAYTNLTLLEGSLGSETFLFDPNSAMALSQITDFSGNITKFAHTDAWTANPDYQAILNTLDVATYGSLNGFYDDPTQQTDALGNKKTFTYYGASRIMQSVTDEIGNETYYDIDNLGRRTSEKMYKGTVASGTLLQETDFTYGNPKYPGFVTEQVRKSLGFATDPSWVTSLVTDFVPDADGRVAQSIQDPYGLHLVSSYIYDANGNKISATDPLGNTTAFTYDSRNRLVLTTFADGSTKQMQYDKRGNKIVDIDENGHWTLYQYDALNRLNVDSHFNVVRKSRNVVV